MTQSQYIACDLGAESGRVMVGQLAAGKLTLDEVHRFSNAPIRVLGALRWDILRIFEELKTGIKKVCDFHADVAGISVDSWGVDYVWFNAADPQLGVPFHYRDPRTDRFYESTRASLSDEFIFSQTGIQFMGLNTLYQLLADKEDRPGVLGLADGFLNIADYLNYLLCGVPRAEESLASTTQLYNPNTRSWADELIQRIDLPRKLFPAIVPSATVLGPLLPDISTETGLGPVPVIATCSHDTGAAVAAVPAIGRDWAYLSSGTWSLIGVELGAPLINAHARALNFTNEAGCEGTIRFLKNIVGLWLLQECRRQWALEGTTYDYDELTRLAQSAEPLRFLIDPGDPRFLRPGDMPEKIRSSCEEKGAPAPSTPGQFVRCILESLALLYRKTLDDLETLTGVSIRVLHIVGGGSKNALLNQCAADATGRQVVAGPVEATAIGNVLIQAIALKHIDTLASLRSIVSHSFPVHTYQPCHSPEWQAALKRLYPEHR